MARASHVVFCTQSQHKEVVAIKCIEKKRLNKHSMENLLMEIRVMKDLNHRHIVKLIDFEVIKS